MPGDSMELSVDFRTQRAAQNAQALNAEIDRMAQSTANAARVVYSLDTAADKLAESTAKAGKNANTLGTEVTKAGQSAQAARQQFDQSGGAIKTTMEGIGKGAENVAMQVKNWIGAYAGLAGAMALLQQYTRYQEKIIQNQREFANIALDRDTALEAVQSNLQLGFTPGGQARARQLVQGMADKTGLDFNNAATLVSSVNAAGFNPLTKAGAASSEAVGKYAALAHLDGSQVEGLSRLISNQGIQGDPRAVQGFLGKLYQTFTKTDTTSQPAFINAAIPSLNLAREKGMDQNEALGLLSAYLSTSATPDQGAERFRMMLRMGEGATPKIAGVMARKARELGITKGGVASLADVESMAAAGDADKKGKLERIRDMESGMIPMGVAISEADTKISELEASPRGSAKAEAARQDRLRVANEHRQELIRRRDERKHDLELAKQAAVEEVQQEKDMDTFQNLTVSTKIKLLQTIFGDVKATGKGARERNMLVSELGGRPELMAATEAASGRVFQEKQRTAAAAAGLPGAGGMLASELENRKIGGVAGTTQADEAIARAQAGEGDIFAQNLYKSAVGQWSIDILHRDPGEMATIGGGAGGLGFGLAPTETGQKAAYYRGAALDFIVRFSRGLTDEERSQYLGAIGAIEQEVSDSQDKFVGGAQIVAINSAMAKFGRIRDEIIQKRRATRGAGEAAKLGGIQLLRPTPRGGGAGGAGGGAGAGGGGGETTQPVIPGSELPAGKQPSSINYNVNVGNYFSTSGADADLTGRLEGAA